MIHVQNRRQTVSSHWRCRVRKFAPYVLKLAELVEQSSDQRLVFNQDLIASALNGEPSRMLRNLVDLETRRENGAFFSGSELGKYLTKKWSKKISLQSVICDPACGGGDLLLAIAKLLPIKEGLRETLESWGPNLRGIDIHEEFIDSSKYRLALQAIASGAKRELISHQDVLKCFPGVRRGDGLLATEEIVSATHIVTNPPFISMQAPEDCNWTSGLVNSAAIFMETIIKKASQGTRVWALLPDVLRSGTRYDKWRQIINSQLRDIQVVSIGQFSRHADVDVFMLEGIVRSSAGKEIRHNNSSWFETPDGIPQVLGDVFTVHVGPVVPHRHLEIGPQSPYLTPHNCPAWKVVPRIDEYRGFSGTLYKPPFVVIRRTSRPNDPYRAIGTIVTDKRNAAIENHLLVLTPKSGTIADCKRLIKVLKSQSTNDWLNQRICCRHLTISSVMEIPWKLNTT